MNDKFKHCGAFLVLTLLLCYVTNADDWASDDAPDGSADGSADAGEKEAGEKEAGEKVAADEAAAAARREAKADQAGEFRRQAIRFGLIALVVVFYAAADEWTQRFVPRRTPDLLDFFADAGGMALGLAIYISAKLVFGKRIRNRFYPAD